MSSRKKRMTLKKKIVLWYSVWMLTFSLIVAIAAIATGSYIQGLDIKEDLEEAEEEAEKLLGMNELSALDSYKDGVYTQIISGDKLVFGQSISELDEVPFSYRGSYKLNTKDSVWYILDSQYDENLTIRVSYAESLRDKTYLLIVFPLLALSIVLSAIGGAFIVNKAFSPLDKMTAIAKSIATGEDLSAHINIPDSSEEEIQHLSASFNQMLSRLENAFEKEKRFADDVSHELRTPVSIISAEAEYSLKHTSDAKIRESLESISNESRKMSNIISQLISISRMEMSRIKPEIENINLDELIEIIIESEEEKAKEKNISISYLKSNISINSDRLMLARVFVNLMENAIQYGRQNGWIGIEAIDSGDTITVSIADNGQGIAKENLDKIFDRFFQEDSSRSRSNNSSGLGLAIVKEIMTILGAMISVKSEKDVGTKFTLILRKN